ncbi:MAG TPA: formyltransferase family protein [Steroidobacteraceae bacterium]|nr:formyltransferase family protein [Steroidobacteraceae bacterium]
MNATVVAGAPSGPVRLRTVFCTCGGLYGALVLARLRACAQLEICGIVRSSRVLDPRFGFLQGAIAQIRRSGLAYALYLWCTTTLADGLCALSGLGRPTRPGDAAARRLTTRDLNDPDGRAFLAECAPDLLVSSFFNQRFRAETLAIPALACLNIHPSLLPDAKGVDPVFQALLHGGPPLGVTVHFMNPEFDAGRILAQQPVEPRRGASVFELTALLYRDGAELLASSIDRLLAGDTGTAQSGPGTYQSWPTAAETAALRRQGGALLRFMDLVRLTRARLPR